MSDYKELIDELRAQCLCITYGDNCNNCEGLISEKAYCRLQIELHKKAADAIEQLVKERDALRDANDSAHRDRREAESKAAKAELEVVCLKEKLADTVDTVKVVHKPTKAEFKRMAAQLEYEPVRHAHWIRTEDNTFIGPCYECSACGRKIKTWAKAEKSAPYCHCGARMDEVSEDDE